MKLQVDFDNAYQLAGLGVGTLAWGATCENFEFRDVFGASAIAGLLWTLAKAPFLLKSAIADWARVGRVGDEREVQIELG